MDAIHEINHIALLHDRAKTSGNTVLFKLPVLRGSEPPLQWKDVTIAEFAARVDRVASFLATELTARGIPSHSVVSILFDGCQHQDLINVMALARASYIPQMFPGRILTHPGVIFSLMKTAGSKILLYDPSFEDLTIDCPYPKTVLNSVESIKSCLLGEDAALPKIEDLATDGSDICFFYLTSGSTSGSPKVVPLTQRFVSIYYRTQFGIWLDGTRFDTPDVFLARGSICNIAQLIQYLGCLYTGSCMASPSRVRFSTEELSNMANACGLNHITTYGTRLVPHIHAARSDPAVLKLLQNMRTVSCGGVPISNADDEWCFKNGIPIMNMFATTECGLVMSSLRGNPSRYLQPVPGLSYRFDPANISTAVSDPTSTQLLTFIILADSPQIPQPHLRSADGNFHTGDLFEKQVDGLYLFRGRNDDWIKSSDADLIDAKAIEENIYGLCGDLVKECVVVGHLKPSPAVFIEVHKEILLTISEDSLKDLLIRRMEDFNTRQYTQERITDKRLVFVVEEGALPRTNKGNFRRKAIEEKYRKELDLAYTSVYRVS